MEKSQLFLSFILIIGGLILIGDVSLSKVTGNVIGETPTIGFSSFGFLFLILGIALLFIGQEGGLEITLAQKIKKSGRLVDSPRELRHIAEKSGYYLGKEVREGTLIEDEYGHRITVIPRHDISSGVARNIINELAKGESNFRRRNY